MTYDQKKLSYWKTSQITFDWGEERFLEALPKIGYDAEWTTLSAKQFGAPQKRAALSLPTPAASDSWNTRTPRKRFNNPDSKEYNEKKAKNPACQNFHTVSHATDPDDRPKTAKDTQGGRSTFLCDTGNATDSDDSRLQERVLSKPIEQMRQPTQSGFTKPTKNTYWQRVPNPPAICRVDDGLDIGYTEPEPLEMQLFPTMYRIHWTKNLRNHKTLSLIVFSL